MTIDFKVIIPRLRLGGVIQDCRTSVWENLLVSTNKNTKPNHLSIEQNKPISFNDNFHIVIDHAQVLKNNTQAFSFTWRMVGLFSYRYIFLYTDISFDN